MVGYVKDSTAVVDEMFQTDELSRYLARMNLAPQWEEGVFDRLTAGEVPGEELGQPQKGCRIWQLRKDVDVTMRFIGYEDLVKSSENRMPATIPRYSKGIWEPMIWSGSMPSAGIALLPDTGDTEWHCPMWWSFTTLPAASFITATGWAFVPSSSARVRSKQNVLK